ncbi:MAG: ABC transporter permease [Clostridiales bacterium]|nr:ABC transporter permease [Clostridiales bacterium]
MKKSPNYNLIVGCTLTAITVSIIVVGFFWTPYDPDAMSVSEKSMAPCLKHILGTDNFGRDILSRVMEGAGTTLSIAFLAVSIGAAFGTLIGGLTGYFGGAADEIIMRINDAVTAFPSILLALVIISITGYGRTNIIIILGILFIPSFARVVRGEFAKQRNMDYVKNAKLMGVRNTRIIFVHILPNIAPVLLSAVAIGFNNAVLAEASMSFLGVGVQPTESASLGRMLLDSQSYLFSSPWQAISAGCAISILILGFALISEGLGYRPMWRPTTKRRRKSNA